MRIANNIAALNTHRWLSIADANVAKSLERLSSGYRINRAADDAAGLAISSRFRAQIKSLEQASRNTTQAIAMLQVAEGSLNEINNILTRLKELATQAASDNTGTDRARLNEEAQSLLAEIDRIAQSTKYSGTQLIYSGGSSWGVFNTLTFQVGYSNNSYDRIQVGFYDINTATLGVNNLSLGNLSDAQSALAAIDQAITSVAVARGGIGAAQNRLEYTASNLAVTIENYTSSESVIRDVDMAKEMTVFTKNQILVQSATAMLAH
ncbi:MAG TPA: flagellin, partial [Desulfobacterales bacterium]|nr:flagellin [Desulfobacterales bacterium]